MLDNLSALLDILNIPLAIPANVYEWYLSPDNPVYRCQLSPDLTPYAGLELRGMRWQPFGSSDAVHHTP